MERYNIILTLNDVTTLSSFLKGTHPARTIKIATALLRLDKGQHTTWHWTLKETSTALDVTVTTLVTWKKLYLQGGIDGVVTRKPKSSPPANKKRDGNLEAHVIALACSNPPEGYSRWSVRLLADKIVELNIIESISKSTVALILKKTAYNHTEQRIGKFPQKAIQIS